MFIENEVNRTRNDSGSKSYEIRIRCRKENLYSIQFHKDIWMSNKLKCLHQFWRYGFDFLIIFSFRLLKKQNPISKLRNGAWYHHTCFYLVWVEATILRSFVYILKSKMMVKNVQEKQNNVSNQILTNIAKIGSMEIYLFFFDLPRWIFNSHKKGNRAWNGFFMLSACSALHLDVALSFIPGKPEILWKVCSMRLIERFSRSLKF